MDHKKREHFTPDIISTTKLVSSLFAEWKFRMFRIEVSIVDLTSLERVIRDLGNGTCKTDILKQMAFSNYLVCISVTIELTRLMMVLLDLCKGLSRASLNTSSEKASEVKRRLICILGWWLRLEEPSRNCGTDAASLATSTFVLVSPLWLTQLLSWLSFTYYGFGSLFLCLTLRL